LVANRRAQVHPPRILLRFLTVSSRKGIVETLLAGETALVELESLTAPVSEADPCGPDLDLEGDPDYLNFLAKAEGILPASYFSVQDGKPFDRGSIDFAAEFQAAKPLLERTRDLRLLATIAKLHILNRDLSAFADCITAVATLLDTQWENVHPRGEGGDYAMRMVAIETLDDLPTVVHPLQFVPLINHRRIGAITYRNYMTATGEVRPRADEEQPLDTATIDKALMESDLAPMVEMLRRFEALQDTLGRIRSIWIERAGFDQAANLDKSTQTIAKIIALLGGVVAKRDPSLAPVQAGEGVEAQAATTAVGQIASREEAAASLAAAAAYFSSVEPSNPALLLVRQAPQLVGKSFVDVIRILVPTYAEQAAIAVGTQHVFDLPVERLSALESGADAPEEYEAPREPLPEQASAWEASSGEPGEESQPAELAAEGDNSGGSLPSEQAGSEPEADVTSGNSGETVQGGSPFEPGTPSEMPNARKQRPRAVTRQQAFALLDQVAGYYRATEPTSPIPVLLDRARALAARDFMSLLKDFLPESALRTITTE
jgi:type VI secretion system protein ImpA